MIKKMNSWWNSLDWRQSTYLILAVLIVVVFIALVLVYFLMTKDPLIRGIITNLLSSIIGFLISFLFYSKIIGLFRTYYVKSQKKRQLLSANRNNNLSSNSLYTCIIAIYGLKYKQPR